MGTLAACGFCPINTIPFPLLISQGHCHTQGESPGCSSSNNLSACVWHPWMQDVPPSARDPFISSLWRISWSPGSAFPSELGLHQQIPCSTSNPKGNSVSLFSVFSIPSLVPSQWKLSWGLPLFSSCFLPLSSVPFAWLSLPGCEWAFPSQSFLPSMCQTASLPYDSPLKSIQDILASCDFSGHMSACLFLKSLYLFAIYILFRWSNLVPWLKYHLHASNLQINTSPGVYLVHIHVAVQ